MKNTHAPLLAVALLLAVLAAQCNPAPSPVTAVPPTATKATPAPMPRSVLVVSTADQGPGTLRQALENAQPGDIITFDPAVFPPDAPTVIELTSSLPELDKGNLTLDASEAGVILNGAGITNPDPQVGISITSDHNTIRGLQITGFSETGVALHGGAQYNTVGGDRGLGTGPLGQGNLISGNGSFGVGLWDENTSHNTIQGNYIGVNLDATATWRHGRDGIHSNGATHNQITGNVIGGSELAGVYLCCVLNGHNTVADNMIGVGPTRVAALSNDLAGVLVDRTGGNVVGPDNTISLNAGAGIMFWDDTPSNKVTRNSIHDNGGAGIQAEGDARYMGPPPQILEFDVLGGTLSGIACGDCTIEIYSDSSDEAAVYEGQTLADAGGAFEFALGVSLQGPHLTASAIGRDGTTSLLSAPTSGPRGSAVIQKENLSLRQLLAPGAPLTSRGPGIGDTYSGVTSSDMPDPAQLGDHSAWLGHTWIRMTFGPAEWSAVQSTGRYTPITFGEYEDQAIDHLNDMGVVILYDLVYFDENLETRPDFLRFRTEQEIQDFLNYARMVATRYRGRIQYYETWNEPDNLGSGQQSIAAEDYIEVIRRLVPVIHEADPQAQVVVGGGTDLRLPRTQMYLKTLLESDIMPLVDAIAIHPMYGSSPDYDELRQYYYGYPALVGRMRDLATAHGFRGRFMAEEMVWRTPAFTTEYEVWTYTPTVAAKYYARGIVTNLGLGVYAGIGGECYDCYPEIVRVLQSLNASLNGAVPAEGPSMLVESEASNIRSYTFSLANGDRMIALWTDGVALDEDSGTLATLIFPSLAARQVVAIDILHGFQQQLVVSKQNGDLVLPDVLLRDYPILLRLAP